MNVTVISVLAATALAAGAATAVAQEISHDPATLYTGWKVLRQFDCARCHGPTGEGSVGPSLVRSASELSEEEFTRLLLDGTVERGMPAFRDVPPVAEAAPAIYAYYKARADGRIGAGKLSPSGEEIEGETSESR